MEPETPDTITVAGQTIAVEHDPDTSSMATYAPTVVPADADPELVAFAVALAEAMQAEFKFMRATDVHWLRAAWGIVGKVGLEHHGYLCAAHWHVTPHPDPTPSLPGEVGATRPAFVLPA